MIEIQIVVKEHVDAYRCICGCMFFVGLLEICEEDWDGTKFCPRCGVHHIKQLTEDDYGELLEKYEIKYESNGV